MWFFAVLFEHPGVSWSLHETPGRIIRRRGLRAGGGYSLIQWIELTNRAQNVGMSMLSSILGLVVSLAVCASLIAVGMRRIRTPRALIFSGIRIPAEIISVKPRGMGSTWAYYPTVRYLLHGQLWQSKPVSGQFALSPRGLNSHRTGEQYIGHRLDVVVDPHNPASSAVPLRDRLAIFMVVLGSVFGGMILLLGIVGVASSSVVYGSRGGLGQHLSSGHRVILRESSLVPSRKDHHDDRHTIQYRPCTPA